MPDSVTAGLAASTEVSSALDALCSELRTVAGGNLRGLILYGGLAQGRFRPKSSDVNLVVLLDKADAGSLRPLAPAFRRAFRAAGVNAFILTPHEVREAADVFPTKFLDIARFHRLLWGENPFQGITVEPEHVRLRVEQELRNMLMRLRHRYAMVADDAAAISAALRHVSTSLAVELRAMLELQRTPPEGEDPPAVLRAAARTLGLDAGVLERLWDLHEGKAPEDPPQLLAATLTLLDAAASWVDRWKAP
jgi:hypothetical protein